MANIMERGDEETREDGLYPQSVDEHAPAALLDGVAPGVSLPGISSSASKELMGKKVKGLGVWLAEGETYEVEKEVAGLDDRVGLEGAIAQMRDGMTNVVEIAQLRGTDKELMDEDSMDTDEDRFGDGEDVVEAEVADKDRCDHFLRSDDEYIGNEDMDDNNNNCDTTEDKDNSEISKSSEDQELLFLPCMADLR
ncbi:hypothetical protein BT69DRAFT_1303134 [Atractiella rhizophila]|nr:hypothetical protein BT69DRAFT_1303134 [Atractiella rhizophila]